jgi:hypothetical protein
VLGDRDRREWAGIERDLADEESRRFVSFEFGRERFRALPGWWRYVPSVGVPLLLPAMSVVEMRPIVSCLAVLLAALVLVGSRLRHPG